MRSIGVSNFTTSQLYDMLSYCRIKPAVNQIERHPFLVQSNNKYNVLKKIVIRSNV